MGIITSEQESAAHKGWKRVGRVGLSAVVAGTAILFALSSAPAADAATPQIAPPVPAVAKPKPAPKPAPKAAKVRVAFVSKGMITTYINYKAGKPFGKLPVAPKLRGYVFQGWFASNGVQATPRTIVPNCKGLTLTAKWAPVKPKPQIIVKVVFNPNGGKVSPAWTVLTFGKSYSLPTPKRPGYVFTGWYTQGGQKVAQSGICSLKHDVTLVAGWQKVAPKPKPQPPKPPFNNQHRP